MGPEVGRYCQEEQDHGLDKSLDVTTLLDLCKPAIERGEKVRADAADAQRQPRGRHDHRQRGHEEVGRKGPAGRHHPTHLQRFCRPELRRLHAARHDLHLEGDANDYVGKGLSGGKLIVYPSAGKVRPSLRRKTSSSATSRCTAPRSGEAYVRGMAGERFAVRNSGVDAVVEASATMAAST
jgi:glutamate synthase domain-containing protein 3